MRKGRFELADGGTIFLDEVGEIPLALQSKLLRVLQEKSFERVGGTKTLSVNVRIISASNRDLREEVAQGRFREDLFYRLNVIHVTLPALRERSDDMPLLVNYFIEKFARQLQKDRPVHHQGRPAAPDDPAMGRKCPGAGEYHRTGGDSVQWQLHRGR